jgi:hypothetical protein
VAFSFKFNEEKNELLKATRKIDFEDILKAIKNGRLLDDITHPSRKYSKQKLYVVEIQGYAYAVPYVINVQKQEIFLKTIYPSRTLTRVYLKGGKDEKKK